MREFTTKVINKNREKLQTASIHTVVQIYSIDAWKKLNIFQFMNGRDFVDTAECFSSIYEIN